jgi:hypothetical protein
MYSHRAPWTNPNAKAESSNQQPRCRNWVVLTETPHTPGHLHSSQPSSLDNTNHEYSASADTFESWAIRVDYSHLRLLSGSL